MPPKRRNKPIIKRKGKKKRGKKKKKKDDSKFLRYIDEINSLQDNLQKLEGNFTDISSSCNVLLDNRNSSKDRYESAIRDKDDILLFLKNYLKYLADQKRNYHKKKESEDIQTGNKIVSFKKCISDLKESAEELGQKLAMDKILLAGRISALDSLKAFRENLMQSIQIAENTISEQSKILHQNISKRQDCHYHAIFTLRTKSENFVEAFRKESTKGYYLSRITKFKKHLKNSLQSRVLFRKFSDAVFVLYQATHQLLQKELKLNQEREFAENVEIKLNDEFKRQDKVIAFLEKEHDRHSFNSNNVEQKTMKLKALREKIVDHRMEIKNLKEANHRLMEAIINVSVELEDDELKYNLQKERCSELIYIMKATEKIVKTENFDSFREIGFSEDETDKLQAEFLKLIDTSQYEDFCTYNFNRRGILQEGSIKSYLLPTEMLFKSKFRNVSNKKKKHIHMTKPFDDKPQNMSEAKILSELGMFRHIKLTSNDSTEASKLNQSSIKSLFGF